MSEGPDQAVPSSLAVNGITKSFPGVQALRDVTFAVKSGEVHALLGENGAGKSTLLKILSGAIRPDAGTISLGGAQLDAHTPLQARHAGIALIHQELALVPQMNAVRNIFLGREIRRDGIRLDRATMEKRARQVVDRLGLDIDLQSPVRTLSMAQRQCIEIARALISEVRVLALDEPTSSLTNRERDRLFEVLRQLRGEGVAIVYVSHRLEELAEIADRATVMRDGAVVDTVTIRDTPRSKLVSMMVGRDLSEYPEPAFRLPGRLALRAKNLSAPSGVFDVSFDAYRGQVLGIAGLVGSGRTELLRVIFGADPLHGGSIEVNGEAFEAGIVRGAIRHKIGLLPEDRKGQALFGRMSIRSNMTLASLETLHPFRRAARTGARIGGEPLDRRSRSTSARCRPSCRRAIGRQSAEDHRRTLAQRRERYLAHRRADSRSRRRCESGDLSHHRSPRKSGRRRHHGVFGLTGGFANERPDRDYAWRTDSGQQQARQQRVAHAEPGAG